MGVEGLWTILKPAGNKVSLLSLRGKVIAVDMSVWLMQLIKAMRDSSGQMIQNAHILGTLRRIMKLLSNHIRPIFVFDGVAPLLKKRVLSQRRQRDSTHQSKIVSLAKQLLARQIMKKQLALLEDPNDDGDSIQDLTKPMKKSSKMKIIQKKRERIILDDEEEEDHENKSKNNNSIPFASVNFNISTKDKVQISKKIINVNNVDNEEEEADDVEEDEQEAGADNTQKTSSLFFPQKKKKRHDNGGGWRSMNTSMTDIDIHQFYQNGEVDFDSIALLPDQMQYAVIKEIREVGALSREVKRKSYIPVAGDKDKYSKVQVTSFLKESALKQKLDKYLKSLNDRVTIKENEKKKLQNNNNDSTVPINLSSTTSSSTNNNNSNRFDYELVEEINQVEQEEQEEKEEDGDEQVKVANDNNEKRKEKENNNTNSVVVIPEEEEEEEDVDTKVYENMIVENSNTMKIKRDNISSSQQKHEIDEENQGDIRISFNPGSISARLTNLFDNLADSDIDEEDDNDKHVESSSSSSMNSTNKNEIEIENRFIEKNNIAASVRKKIGFVLDDESGDEEEENMKDVHVQNIPLKESLIRYVEDEINSIPLLTVPLETKTKEDEISIKVSAMDSDSETEKISQNNERVSEQEEILTADTQQVLRRVLANAPNLSSWAQGHVKRALKEHVPLAASSLKLRTENSQVVDNNNDILQIEHDEISSSSRKQLNFEEVEFVGDDTKTVKLDLIPTTTTTTATSSFSTFPNEIKVSNSNNQDEILIQNSNNTQNSLNTESKKQIEKITKETMEKEQKSIQLQLNRARRDAEVITTEMKEEVIELLDILGLPYVLSTGEAEAQCAALELAGIVYGVVTNDADAFLFGAERVFKNVFSDKNFVEAYTMSDITRTLGLQRADLINMALLLGSDYTIGVRGIGPVHSLEVLDAFPGGTSGLIKFRKWLDSDFEDLEKQKDKKNGSSSSSFSDNDEEELDVESTETKSFKKRHKTGRRKWVVEDNFPSMEVINAYLNPKVIQAEYVELNFGNPNLQKLEELMVNELGYCREKFESEFAVNIRNYMKGPPTQRIMDEFVIRYEDKQKFAAIVSSRIQKAVVGLRKKANLAEESEPLVLDEEGSLLSLTAAIKKRDVIRNQKMHDKKNSKLEKKKLAMKSNEGIDSEDSSSSDDPFESDDEGNFMKLDDSDEEEFEITV